MTRNSVVKKTIFKRGDRFGFLMLASLYLFLLLRYLNWWFQPQHIPSNWIRGSLHFFDFAVFAMLSFVVFIGATQRLGSLFALWFASKPEFLTPREGLKVAFLTCYVPGKEPLNMLIKTLKAMKRVRYSHDTWILDEGDSDEVKEVCLEFGVKYFTRKGIEKYNQEEGLYRTKTKAGNHNSWADAYGKDYDIVAQIDMDHVPDPDYFEKTLGFFRDPKVGFVGMPQYYKNTDNWIARGAAEQSYFFHGPMQQGFYGSSDMPFLIGTSHIYRTKAMNKIGGYAPTIVEDHLTGMKFYEHGFKGVYVPEILARGEGPLNWVDYFNQQMRWSYGLFEILFKHTPKIIGKLKWRQKINYLLAQLYYFTGVAVIVGMGLTFAYLVFGVRAASMNLWSWLSYSAPPFLLATAIQIFTHRFSIDPEKEPIFGPLGMFLNLGANLIYALALIKLISGQKLKYMVTQKGSAGQKQLVPISTFTMHMGALLLLGVAFIESFYNQHEAIQLRFWALFNIVTLGAVVISVYWDGLQEYFERNRFVYQSARAGLSLSVFVLIFSSVLFVYSQRTQVVRAFIGENLIEEQIPMAGKLESPKKGTYLGVSLYQHNNMDALRDLQNRTNMKFAIVGYYQSWGVKENQFDKTWAQNISANGSVPMITWEPWVPVSGFDRSESVVNQEDYRLKNIVNGKYDGYISQYAKDIKSYRRPVMIRLAHEMNGNWYPWGSTFNSPSEYVLAWRHVHEIFDKEGASNVTWVWSPNEVYFEKKVPYADNIELFYPGDDYVDWVGFSAFNWAGSYMQNYWVNPKELYGPTLKKMKQFNKPIIITETASAESPNKNLSKAGWIKLLAEFLKSHPEVKGLVWFNTIDNGVKWNIDSTESSRKSFEENFKDYFIQTVKNI